MHPDEWAQRQQLAACYRVFALLGWTEMIYNHITLRLPDSVTGARSSSHQPFGLHYSEVTASNLVKIDLQGRVLDGSPTRSTPPAVVHGAIHGLPGPLRDAHPHHRRRGRGLRAGGCSKPTSTPRSCTVWWLHDFEGITVHADEGPRLVNNIRGKPAVILRNHGLLAYGQTPP
jgi:ribulose-5-phosphate 4-epimerase/fuculose-1-phosphate aldolase